RSLDRVIDEGLAALSAVIVVPKRRIGSSSCLRDFYRGGCRQYGVASAVRQPDFGRRSVRVSDILDEIKTTPVKARLSGDVSGVQIAAKSFISKPKRISEDLLSALGCASPAHAGYRCGPAGFVHG